MKAAVTELGGDLCKEMLILNEQLMREIAECELMSRNIQLGIIRQQKEDRALCKRVAIGRTVATHSTPKIEASKPKSFIGNRNAREIDNFL